MKKDKQDERNRERKYKKIDWSEEIEGKQVIDREHATFKKTPDQRPLTVL